MVGPEPFHLLGIQQLTVFISYFIMMIHRTHPTTFYIFFVKIALFTASSLFAEDSSHNTSFENKEGFTKIFNGKDLTGWYLKIRNEDQDLAKQVFSIKDEMIHVFNDTFPDEYELNTGGNATHGLIYSKKTYSKYILRFEYKWGKRIANNFEKWQYDAGVYYHVRDDRIWPMGIEYQIRYNHVTGQNHTGDFIIPKKIHADWYGTEDGSRYLGKKDGGKIPEKRHWLLLASETQDHHALDDQWNQCEIIVMGGDYTIHKLNGKIVNVAHNMSFDSGIFGFQSETAEIFYRNIYIKEFEESVPIDVFLK